MTTPPMGPFPQQGPSQAPPSPPKKKSHAGLIVVLSIIGGVVLLCGIGGVAMIASTGGSTDSGNSTGTDGGDSGKAAAPAKAHAAKVGDPVRDGNFEFVVQKMQCGVSRIGSADFGADAQGQYCLVTMSVKNVKSDSQTFDSSNQLAFDTNGRKFDSDPDGDLYTDGGESAFLNDINPGNRVTGTVVFDVPRTAKITKLELHDSMFSGGVTVDMT